MDGSEPRRLGIANPITSALTGFLHLDPPVDWTFAAAMRAFLRPDPDVIMVGEMRDAEKPQKSALRHR